MPSGDSRGLGHFSARRRSLLERLLHSGKYSRVHGRVPIAGTGPLTTFAVLFWEGDNVIPRTRKKNKTECVLFSFDPWPR